MNKTCTKCKKLLGLEYFHKDKYAKDKLRSFCKRCACVVGAKNRSKNIDDARKRDRDYYHANSTRINTNKRDRYWKNPEKHRDQRNKYTKENKLKNRNYYLKATYGLDLEDFECLLILQEYACGICNATRCNVRDVLSVDHCHKTGSIRGLLCHNCNIALGSFKDSIYNLKKAISYIGE